MIRPMSGRDTTGAGRQANDAAHWERVHAGKSPEGVSWYEASPTMSLQMLNLLGATVNQAIVDVGGGAGVLPAVLTDRGYRDITIVEISAVALTIARQRCGRAPVEFAQTDVLEWRPSRRYDIWHDRAVFHFLTEPEQRHRYRETLLQALAPVGGVVIGVFASDGPPSCSGLPVVRYDVAGLVDALGEGFTVVSEERDLHVTPRGVIQPFTWLALRRVG